MKIKTNGDELTVETSKRDAEFLQASADMLGSVGKFIFAVSNAGKDEPVTPENPKNFDPDKVPDITERCNQCGMGHPELDDVELYPSTNYNQNSGEFEEVRLCENCLEEMYEQ